MVKNFFYEKKLHMSIDKISIIGSFNNFEADRDLLIEDNGIWSIDLNVDSGTYRYKYILDNYIRINDPYADEYISDEEGEVWSVVNIPSKDNLNIKGQIEFRDYVITNRVWNSFNTVYMKKEIDVNHDKKVAVGIESENISGLHSMTVVWYRPDMLIHHIAEEALYVEEGDLNNAAETWFWIDLDEEDREYPLGIWRVSIFIDGEYIVEDAFELRA